MRQCSVQGCERPHYGRSWCALHYQRQRRLGTTDGPPPPQRTRACAIEGCEASAFARRWCKTHYHRWSRHGDPEYILPVEERANWRGGRWVQGNGYVMVLVDEDDPICGPMRPARKYVGEHRVVMARHVGRPLLPEETVHHINGIKDDNRIENLELWSSSQPSGQRVEDKLAWAREIIALYGSGD